MVEFIGYLAGFIAMVSFLPQVVKTLRSRSAQDISLAMLFLTFLTNILYLIYGIALKLTPIIVMLSIMTVIVLLQIALTIKFRFNNKRHKKNLKYV